MYTLKIIDAIILISIITLAYNSARYYETIDFVFHSECIYLYVKYTLCMYA